MHRYELYRISTLLLTFPRMDNSGLAQLLSIRLSRRYPHCQLVSINAHSLFSKWFSESGKLVLKLFQRHGSIVILVLHSLTCATEFRIWCRMKRR